MSGSKSSLHTQFSCECVKSGDMYSYKFFVIVIEI